MCGNGNESAELIITRGFHVTEIYSENLMESAIHIRCSESSDLMQNMDSFQIFTGTPMYRNPPFISFQRKNARPVLVTNNGSDVDEAYFVISIIHADYEKASLIVTIIRNLFDSAMWSVNNRSELILRSEILENDTIQRNDAIWEWGMTLRVRLFRTSGF
jgi:hypothetical protein